MVSGVFMQRGDLITMLNLFKNLKNMGGVVSTAKASYKVVEPSFPSSLTPTFSSLKAPLLLTTPVGALKVEALGGQKRSKPPRLRKNPRGLAFFFFRGRLKRLMRGFKLKGLGPKLGRPVELALPGTISKPRGLASYPKQNSLAI
jgi:hypothetical protein